MADEKTDEKTVERELLADHMRVDDVEYFKGDVVSVPEERAKELEEHGVLGEKGTTEKAEKDVSDAEARDAHFQKMATGMEPIVVPEDDDSEKSASNPEPKPAPRQVK